MYLAAPGLFTPYVLYLFIHPLEIHRFGRSKALEVARPVALDASSTMWVNFGDFSSSEAKQTGCLDFNVKLTLPRAMLT